MPRSFQIPEVKMVSLLDVISQPAIILRKYYYHRIYAI